MENGSQEDQEYRYKSVVWTPQEALIRKSREKRHSQQDKYCRSFKQGLLLKLKSSIFRCFIDVFNSRQHQDEELNKIKLAILNWEMKSYSSQDFERFRKNNEFIQNGFEYLKKTIEEGKRVTLNHFMETPKYLRLEATYVRK